MEDKEKDVSENEMDEEPKNSPKEKTDGDKENVEGKEEEKKEEQASESTNQKPEKTDDKPDEVSKPQSQSKEETKTEKPPQEPKKEVKVSSKLSDIIKNIEGLSVLELSDLVKALEDKFGVTAAAPAAVGSATPAEGDSTEESTEEDKTSFNVIIADGGSNKIGSIKAVRELVPSLGLKEAKDLVDAAPKQVLEGVGKDAANEAKQKLEAAGAKVELQ